jgi:4-hydroxy-tetrahydrodipicolinate synthase
MELKGIITAMASPLDDNFEISPAGVKQLVNHLIDRGVAGIFILGTNGEFFSMSTAQKLRYAELAVKAAAGRVPVFAGSGGINTQEVIELTNEFEKKGVTAVSIIVPYLINLTQQELIGHYESIAAHTKLPIILYNIPGNTKNNLEPATIAQLAKNDHIIGVKDSSGDLEAMKLYLALTSQDDFSVLVGSDSRILKALRMGATGAIAATSNVLTNTDVKIYEAFLAGDGQTAEKYQESINEYRRILKFASGATVLKYTLNQIGIAVGKPFPPVSYALSESQKDEIADVLAGYEAVEHFQGATHE